MGVSAILYAVITVCSGGMETEAQMMETRVFNYVCGAKWFNLNYYENLLNRTGLRLLEKGTLHTGKKLTPRHARKLNMRAPLSLKFMVSGHVPLTMYGRSSVQG